MRSCFFEQRSPSATCINFTQILLRTETIRRRTLGSGHGIEEQDLGARWLSSTTQSNTRSLLNLSELWGNILESSDEPTLLHASRKETWSTNLQEAIRGYERPPNLVHLEIQNATLRIILRSLSHPTMSGTCVIIVNHSIAARKLRSPRNYFE